MTDTTTIQPGGIAIDYSFARPDPQRLHAAGVQLVCRYISPGNNTKNLTAGERDALLAAGLGVLLVWEHDANSAAQGRGLGQLHGVQAAQQAAALGYPVEVPIIVAVDFGVAASQVSAVADYFRGFAQGCGRPLAVYGGTVPGDAVCGLGLAQWVWRANASSWSPPGVSVAHVALEQFLGIKHPSLAWAVGQIDDGQVVQPVTVWCADHVEAAAGTLPAQLNPGDQLTIGATLTCGPFTLLLQQDHNLVLYYLLAPIWASNSMGSGADRFIMQTDGNAVLYQGQTPVGSTNTFGHPGSVFQLQADGNMVVRAPGNVAVWASRGGVWR